MKTKQVAISKSQQKRIAIQGESIVHKNPRVPIFPPDVVPLVNKLNSIIEANDERRHLAYGLLTRLCVLWSQPGLDPLTVRVDLDVKTGLLHFDSELLRDAVALMEQLFPNGEGLPEQHGAGPL